jgi:hypothetical protein
VLRDAAGRGPDTTTESYISATRSQQGVNNP